MEIGPYSIEWIKTVCPLWEIDASNLPSGLTEENSTPWGLQLSLAAENQEDPRNQLQTKKEESTISKFQLMFLC